MSDSVALEVQNLRRAFDQIFADPYPAPRRSATSLLTVRAGKSFLALRTAELRVVLKCPPLVPLPSSAESLLGIASVRGVLVGMYGLAHLTGSASSTQEPAWAALCGDGSVGLVFDALEGCVQVDEDVIRRTQGSGARSVVPDVVEIGTTLRGVVDIPSLLRTILKPGARVGAEEE